MRLKEHATRDVDEILKVQPGLLGKPRQLGVELVTVSGPCRIQERVTPVFRRAIKQGGGLGYDLHRLRLGERSKQVTPVPPERRLELHPLREGMELVGASVDLFADLGDWEQRDRDPLLPFDR